MLIVFGGLPGVGKTALARTLAAQLGAVYLRMGAIEQTLGSSAGLAGEVGPADYPVAYPLAESNLRLGQVVVADCVNLLALTRDAWRQAAERTGSRIVEIEVICSDRAEHRRRVETRSTDVAGLKLPSWEDVMRRDYEPWDRPRILIDTAARTAAEALTELLSRIDG
jgi:predicted kinase